MAFDPRGGSRYFQTCAYEKTLTFGRIMQLQLGRRQYFTIISTLLVAALLVGCSHKRTDAEIASEVQNKINADPNISTKQISAGDTNGVVTLSGSVNSDLERIAAANDASQVEGVKTVVNNLQV